MSLRDTAERIASGATSARQVVEDALELLADPSGEGPLAVPFVAADRARTEADAVDRARVHGARLAPFAGVPTVVKDNFDVAGETTTAGSVALAEGRAATADATAVKRLRAAGFINLGRAGMTELAYSGLGLNPHYGTPTSPWDRRARRIPGGSSAGTAVAVGDQIVPVGLGTDTGGSCRIPAAFCGVVGFKPTARNVPQHGVLPLAPSFDSVGILGQSVAACRAVFSVLAGISDRGRTPSRDLTSVRLGLLTSVVLDSLDNEVAQSLDLVVSRLSERGVHVENVAFHGLDRFVESACTTVLAPAEAHVTHRDLVARHGGILDPRVKARLNAGAETDLGVYVDAMRGRRSVIEEFGTISAPFDAVIAPTVAFLPPTLSSLESDTEYFAANSLALRNTSIANLLDACSVSLPLYHQRDRGDRPPVGLMLTAPAMGDQRLLDLAEALEGTVADIGSR